MKGDSWGRIRSDDFRRHLVATDWVFMAWMRPRGLGSARLLGGESPGEGCSGDGEWGWRKDGTGNADGLEVDARTCLVNLMRRIAMVGGGGGDG